MAFDPVSAALDIGGKIIDRVWPDPAQKDAAKLALLQLYQTGALAQLTADTDLATWRPAHHSSGTASLVAKTHTTAPEGRIA